MFKAQLLIRLTPGPLRAAAGVSELNVARGGPETLLRWLEIQLGLPVANCHVASRVTEYAAALDAVDHSVVSRSFTTDRWATASELLARRDELLLSGWMEDDSDTFPVMVRDLAKASKNRSFAFPGIADRLKRILESLDAGQRLPDHVCTLVDPLEKWPTMWQRVLSRLSITNAPINPPAARPDTALHSAQKALIDGSGKSLTPDTSFRQVQTLSQTAAVEFVAAVLARDPDTIGETVVVCENQSVAMSLDACLNRLGLPTMGVATSSTSHPVLQVLPLSLMLCREPVNPQSLLDFLSLPVSPIPRRAATRLAEALAQEPGLGSGAWDDAMTELCSNENDHEGKLRERLEAWLFCNRCLVGEMIPAALIRSRCDLVSQWAAGRAAQEGESEDPNPRSIQALQIAAGQASLLGELSECQGASVSVPQLSRLIQEALSAGAEMSGFVEACGGPTYAKSLAEITHSYRRLIWLGLSTGDAPKCRWSTDQIRQLQTGTVQLDDGSNALSALRSSEMDGFLRIQDACLVVALPEDMERRWHPIWLAIRKLWLQEEKENPNVLEDLIQTGTMDKLLPFACDIEQSEIEPPQPRRAHWKIPQELMKERTEVSAAELQDRLACPLKWVFNYQARLRSSPIARLPEEFRLKGTFCHSVFERVFNQTGELTNVEDAVTRVLDVFDSRVSLDAAPLAQPYKYLERQKLRRELAGATRTLAGILIAGQYRIKGIEVPLSGEAFGKTLIGSIDCVAEQTNGSEAIIDFKYGGRSKYHDLIRQGKAVQLATYAYGRSLTTNAFPAVAYLVLSDAQMFTPSGSSVHGDLNRVVIDACSIQEVWNKFAEAIENCDGWLTGECHVPARPLLEPIEWPPGAELVLDAELKPTASHDVCRYCDYQQICGLQELK
jgi:ATP-dependent helicase/nuclease subunit B